MAPAGAQFLYLLSFCLCASCGVTHTHNTHTHTKIFFVVFDFCVCVNINYSVFTSSVLNLNFTSSVFIIYHKVNFDTNRLKKAQSNVE